MTKVGTLLQQTSYRVVHVSPYDAIGGVETAIRSMQSRCYGSIGFTRFYLTGDADQASASNVVLGRAKSLNSPFELFKSAIALRRVKPDLIIASLWRSVAVAIIAHLFSRRSKLVVFLHSSEDAHRLDALVTWIGARLCHQIWADSAVTLNERLGGAFRSKGRVISFVVERLPPHEQKPPSPSFAFWGRLHATKRVADSLVIFASIAKRIPNSRFDVIGPDGGERARLEAKVRDLGIQDAVYFHGGADLRSIRQLTRTTSFFLQTSCLEGMGLAVVEAMQLGLVPIVKPVGGIPSYTFDNVNSVHVKENPEYMAARIIDLIFDPDRFHTVRNAAVEAWKNMPLYRTDVLKACAEIAEDDQRRCSKATE